MADEPQAVLRYGHAHFVAQAGGFWLCASQERQLQRMQDRGFQRAECFVPMGPGGITPWQVDQDGDYVCPQALHIFYLEDKVSMNNDPKNN